MTNVIIGGDFCPINIDFKKPDVKCFSDSVQNLLKGADISVVNLEAPITDSSNAIRKTGPNLKLHNKSLDHLAHVDLVTLANNHILDYGEDGLRDTLNHCDKAGIDVVGAGLNREDATKTWVKTIELTSTAIVNICENEWVNVPDSEVGAHSMNLPQNAREIKEASELADVVIVIVHGGHELHHYPSPRMVDQYRFYIDMGASVVINHHTHCVSGYEIYNGAPIFYGIGNLFFPSRTNFSGWYEGVLVNLKYTAEELSWELIPYSAHKENDFVVTLLEGDERKDLLRRIDEFSSVINSKDELQATWYKFVHQREVIALNELSCPFPKWRLVLNKLKFSLLSCFPNQVDLLLNLIRCEAHRDKLIAVLEKKKNNRV